MIAEIISVLNKVKKNQKIAKCIEVIVNFYIVCDVCLYYSVFEINSFRTVAS